MRQITRIASIFLITSMPLFAHGQQAIVELFTLFVIMVFVVLSVTLSVIFFTKRNSAPESSAKKLPVSEMVEAWREAAKTLNFEFEPNFRFQLDGLEFTFLGYVKHFGAPKGALLGPLKEQNIRFPGLVERLRALGFFYSELSDSYSVFRDDLYKDTLNDFGYFGPNDKKPAWYTGESWA